MKPAATIKKPSIASNAALALSFAEKKDSDLDEQVMRELEQEGKDKRLTSQNAPGSTNQGEATPKAAKKGKASQKAAKASSGWIPEGDVRLVANIDKELHTRLKVAAAQRRTTIGELIEDLIKQNC